MKETVHLKGDKRRKIGTAIFFVTEMGAKRKLIHVTQMVIKNNSDNTWQIFFAKVEIQVSERGYYQGYSKLEQHSFQCY